MRLRLSKNPRAKYSPAELSLLQILAIGKKPIKLGALALGHYSPGLRPFNWQPIVRVTLNQLMKKMELNKEAWRIDKIKTPGEKEIEYKLKRRNAK